MSENPMDGYGAPEGDQSVEAPPGRNPKVLIAGGIGLALVAVVGGYLFLGGGSGDSTTALPPHPVTHPVATTTPATAKVIVVGKATPAVRTFNGEVGRDPFAALITQSPAPTPVKTTASAAPHTSAPVSTSAAPTLTPTAPVTNPVTQPTTPVVTTTPAPTTAPPTTTAPPQAVLVVLKAIEFPTPSTPAVHVIFGGKSYVLKTGETAAGSLKVVAIAPDDGTATFQLGDQTFDLHVGQSFVD